MRSSFLARALRRPLVPVTVSAGIFAALLAVTAPAHAVTYADPTSMAAGPNLGAPVSSLRADDVPNAFPADLMPTDANEDAEEVPGEVAIDLRDSLSDAEIDQLEADYGRDFGLLSSDASEFSRHEDNLLVGDVDPSREDALLARLAADPRVESAERMEIFRASFVPNDPLYTEKQWHLSRVGAEKAWDYGCGAGVTVAVIDTGVACFDKGPFSRGSDLAGTRCEGGYDFVGKNHQAADDNGHGTHVAGTIAQTTNNGQGGAGLAFCANVMPIKVLSKGGYGSLAQVAEGIRFAADHGAQVANLSLGGPFPSRILGEAVRYAQDKGVLIVAAAGNSGRGVGYPAAYSGVLAVSATDKDDNLAWFSSRGKQVGIAAPGVAVTQQTICNGGQNRCEIFGTFNGTSMASPHVAGAAALVMADGMTDPAAVRADLEATATAKEDKNFFGAGILNAGKAIARAHWLNVAIRALALFALFGVIKRRIQKRGGKLQMTPFALFGALTAATGLLPFAPLLHLPISRAGMFLLSHPFGEWSLASSVGLHRFLPLANAGPVLAAAVLLFGIRRARPLLGGFALGMAALLVQYAVFADVAFFFGSVALRIWMVVNVLVCLWIARLSLDGKRS
jgi:serine protease